MRGLAIVPLLALAACGDAGGANQAANAQPAAAERIEAGQWALQSEVTMFAKADNGTPAIDMPRLVRNAWVKMSPNSSSSSHTALPAPARAMPNSVRFCRATSLPSLSSPP